MILIFDSSPLIALLRECDGLDLPRILKDAGHDLYIPSEIVIEISKEPTKSRLNAIIKRNIMHNRSINNVERLKSMILRYPTLGKGELEVINLAMELDKSINESKCVIDDKLARKIAERHGLQVIGTLGLIRLMRESNLISDEKMNDLLNQLESSTFRMNRKICKVITR